MRSSPLSVSKGVQNLLVSNYDSTPRIARGGMLLAGRRKDFGWY